MEAQAKQEVDLVLYGEKGLHAIEVKRSDRIRKEEFESLQLFKKDYPMAQLHFVFGGNDAKIVDDIFIWPLEKFLRDMPVLKN
ncbi:MAG: hypothetical protein ACXVCY_03710 [Pseudobdellovibrionaceae bacterium]